MKIAFWNVAVMRNKDRNFWANLKRWDINGNMDEEWNNVRGRDYQMEAVKKRNKKRRVMTGLVMD